MNGQRKIVTPLYYLGFGLLLFFFSFLVVAQGVLLDSKVANTVGLNTNETNAAITQIAVADLPLHLSPYADNKLAAQYAHLFFDPLVRWSHDKGIENRLVKRRSSKQNGKIRFHLKKNIRFHSGYKLTSRDVSWTFNYLQKTKKSKAFFSSIKKIKVINKTTFDIYSESSEAALLDLLTHFFILDARFYKRNDIVSNQKYGIIYPQNSQARRKSLPFSGTGPFVINSYNPHLNLKIARNEKYWGKKSFFTYLNFVLIKSNDSRVYSLVNGDVSISEGVSNSLIDPIVKSSQHEVIELPYIESFFLTINSDLVPAFRDKTARKGLALSINRKGMMRYILKGNGTIGSSFLAENSAIKNTKKESEVEYNLEKVKKLLSNSLVPNYISLLVMETNSSDMKLITNGLYNMLHRAGIKLITKTVSSKEEWDKNKDKYSLTLSAWGSDFVIADNKIKSLFQESALSPLLLKNFPVKNAKVTTQQYFERSDLVLNNKEFIPLFSQHLLFATKRDLNLSNIFSKNGIPYWVNLKFKTKDSNNDRSISRK